MKVGTLVLLMMLVGAPGAWAQAGNSLESEAQDCRAITDVTLHLPGAQEVRGTLVWRGDRIVAAGPDARAPAGCSVTAARPGWVVTAGLIESQTAIGLVEVGLEAASVDLDQLGEKGGATLVRASFEAIDGFNPRSMAAAVARLGGVTSVIAGPRGGVVSGQSLWADLTGGSQRRSVQKASAALHGSLGGGPRSRGYDLSLIKGLIADAETVMKLGALPAAKRLALWQIPATRVDEARAFIPVLTGKIPLVIRVDRASDIEALLRAVAGTDIRLVIAGGAEAWLVAESLARQSVPVIVDPLLYGIETFDQHHARRDLAAHLDAAGVPVLLSSFETYRAGTLRQAAGNAVREGMDRLRAIEAITTRVADVFGMKDHGRLATGAFANLVVWSGDPLELSTQVTEVIVHGASMPLTSRQTELRDRYRVLPGSPLPGLVPTAIPAPAPQN